MKFGKKLNLITQFIRRSPRNQIKDYNKVMQFNKIPTLNLPSNIDYLNKFLSDIDCQHLIFSQYQLNSPFRQSLYATNKANNQQAKKTTLVEMLKSMDKLNVEMIKYFETEQMLNLMTPEEANKLKKYLIYFCKLLIKQKKKLSQTNKELNVSLTQLVTRKIIDGNEYQENNKKTKEQMVIQSLLMQARESHKIGDLQSARQKYQTIYRDTNVEDKLRMQALRYLCQKGRQKGDINYLTFLMNQAKMQGACEYEKYVLTQMQKITEFEKKD